MEGFRVKFEFDSKSGQLPTEVGIVKEISDDIICRNARFRFDRPITFGPKDFAELKDGQWFLNRCGEETLIEGKWETIG